MISMVSALDIDNAIRYEKEDMKVTLTNNNWFGVGEFIGIAKDLGTLELKSHENVNEWRGVGLNNQIATWYDFDFSNNLTNGLGEVKIIDLKTGEETKRPYTFFIGTPFEIDIFGEGNCRFLKNSTRHCDQVVVSKRNTTLWSEYNSKDIPSGKNTIGVEVFIEEGDQLDIIWTVGGKEVTRHAVVYAFLDLGDDDNAGASVSTAEGIRVSVQSDSTINNVTVHGNSGATKVQLYLATGSGTGNLITTADVVGDLATFTANATVNTSNQYFIVGYAGGSSYQRTYYTAGAPQWWPQNNGHITGIKSVIVTGGEFDDWLPNIRSIYTYTGSLNTAPNVDLISPVDALTTDNPVIDLSCLAYDNSGITNVSLLWNGTVDQTNSSGYNNTVYNFTKTMASEGLWNWSCQSYDDANALNNSAEVREITYDDPSPVINLISPANDEVFIIATNDFDCTPSDNLGITNVSLRINDTVTQTNSSGYNDTQVTFSETIASQGFWNWSCITYDSIDQLTVSANRNFTYVNPPPVISLITPTNETVTFDYDVDFDCVSSDNVDVTNVSLYVDGVFVDVDVAPANDTSSLFSDTLTLGWHNWTCDAYDDLLARTIADDFYVNISNNLITEIKTPIEDFNSSIATVSFVGNASDDTDLINVSLYLNSILNQTNTSGFNATNYTFTTDVEDGDSDWYFEACDEFACVVSGINNFTVDTIYPIVNDAQNITDLVAYEFAISSIWNYTATDLNIDSCYYNTTEDASLTIITCNASETTAWASKGNKTIQYCANDTVGLETCKEAWVYVYELNYTQTDNPDPVGEGVNVTFTLNLSLENIPTTTAMFMLNETFYTVDSVTSTSDYYNFTHTVTIPDGYGSVTGLVQPYYWNYTIDGVTTNISTAGVSSNVTVYSMAIDDCTLYGDVILNLTVNDEEGNTEINQTAGSNLEIDLLITSIIDPSLTWTYENTWVNDSNVTVCIPSNILNNSEYYIDFDIGFDSTDHVWEFYFLDDGVLNETKQFDPQTNYIIDLMDLLSADSTSFLFNYFDVDGLPVPDAITHTFRKYIGEGLFREVERSQADENGDTIVHLVEEDVIYFFLITQYGIPLYTSSNYNALCQAVPCTIQLEAGGESADFGTDWDLIDGGSYDITSDASTRIVTLNYSLNESAIMNLTVYKYDFDGEVILITSNQSTGTTDYLTLDVPQGAGNVSFFATVYQDGQFINSEWINFESTPRDRFGVTLALFLGALIILTLGLMAVTEGVGTLVMVILGVAISGALGLVTTTLSTGINVVVYLILAGGILLWKLTGGRK